MDANIFGGICTFACATLLILCTGIHCAWNNREQIDEEITSSKPDKEGWSFSLIPRRVDNETVFLRFYYYKMWCYGTTLKKLKYYKYNPHMGIETINDDK